MIIIGSSAIKHWFPDFLREPKDIDIIHYGLSSEDQWSMQKFFSKQLEFSNWGDFKPFPETHYPDNIYLEPSLLLTLKASHLCWNINWEKHMFDVQFLLKKGCKIQLELFWELYNHWNVYHSKNKRSDLKMSKNEFFTNAVNYDVLEHDDLHKILNPVPIYTRVQKEGSEVELDEEKFKLLDFEEKLDFVREEVMVMAWERFKTLDYRSAYSKMLKKFIISHAPLFSLIFIIENYIELHKPKINYFKILEDGIRLKSDK